MAETTRIQIDLPNDMLPELNRLMREMRITSRKDLFLNAFSLLSWVANEKRAERVLLSVESSSNKTPKELVVLPLVNTGR